MGRGVTYNQFSGLSLSVGGTSTGGTDANRVVNISTGNTVTFYSFSTGSTVFNISGTSSNLLSVTDSTTGDLFTVTDVSGNTLMAINSTSAPKFANIVSGNTDTRVLTINNSGVISFSNTAKNSIVFADALSADTAINSTSLVTILSKTVSGITAGDTIEVIIVFNTVTNGVAPTLTAEIALGTFTQNIYVDSTSNSASENAHWSKLVFSVVSTSFTYLSSFFERQQAPQTAGTIGSPGGLGTNFYRVWNTSSSDLTGTQTLTFKIKSNSTTATQTCKLRHYQISLIKEQV